MKTKLLILLMLAGTSLFAAPRVVIGVGVGPGYGYYAPPPVVYAPPPVVYTPPPVVYAPPVYSYGYYPYRPYYRPYRPFVGAVWVGPRYYRHHYYRGYWRR
jgi:hypothetical protein